MWFNPAEIKKIGKPPIATLANLATYYAKGNTECSKVAEVAEVATTHDSKIAPLHEPAMELIAEPGVIAELKQQAGPHVH